jgi:hypothetical protein
MELRVINVHGSQVHRKRQCLTDGQQGPSVVLSPSSGETQFFWFENL